MSRSMAILGGLLVVLGLLATSAVFTVHQTQQALVLQFGRVERVETEPGLKFKIPFIQDVLYFEKRVLDLDPPKEQVILADQKRLDVDSYARFKIVDPLMYRQAVKTESGARTTMNPIINSSVRRVLGNETLVGILSDKRVEIMKRIHREVNQAVEKFGIEIIEVRIRRADYPEQTSSAIYNRMKSEREREAKEFRAQGFEEGQKIRADADRQRVVLVAEAKQTAETTRGEGDAKAIKIYADAFGQDPDFFAFYRSMQAYRNAMGQDAGTTMVLSPDSEFFRYFNDMTGAPKQ